MQTYAKYFQTLFMSGPLFFFATMCVVTNFSNYIVADIKGGKTLKIILLPAMVLYFSGSNKM